MRGKAGAGSGKTQTLGITPAYAGKSVSYRNFLRLFLDHPRLCGEKLLESKRLTVQLGSPPPMRGKAMKSGEILFGGGITPAYAGKSLHGAVMIVLLWDHPRLCGEKEHFCCWYAFSRGSPPPMRGKVIDFCPAVWAVGITPAYAGKR